MSVSFGRPRRVLPVLLAGLLWGCGAAAPRAPRPVGEEPPTVLIPPLPLPFEPPPPPAAEERGLEFRLRALEGEAPRPVGERAGPAATPLPESEAGVLLGRLPALPAARPAEFAFPAQSPPPPRTGAVVAAPFPPPDSLPRPRPDAVPAEERLEVVRISPTGETELAPHLTLSFSHAMVPLTTVGALEAERVPARLDPQPPGRWSWIDTRTLRFQPEGRFPMATRFRVEVPPRTRSVAGVPLAGPVRAEFSTPAPVAVGGWPHSEPLAPPPAVPLPRRRPPVARSVDGSGGTGLQPVILLVFDQRVDPARVLATTSLRAGSASHPLRLATDAEVAADSVVRRLAERAEEGRWVALRPAEPLPRETLVAVRVGPGTPSVEGPRTTEVIQELRFRTHGPLEVLEHGCPAGAEGACPPGTSWRIHFSNPLDPGLPWDSLVSVEPRVPGLSVTVQGHDLYLSGGTRPLTTYRVTLDARAGDVFGQRLGEPRTLTFAVGEAAPFLALSGAPLVVLDPAGPAEVLVRSRGIESMRARVYRVGPEDWGAFGEALRRFQEGRGQGTLDPPGELVVDSTLRPGGGEGGFAITSLDLSAAIPGGIGHAVVVVDGPPAPTLPPDPRRGRPDRQGPAFAWVQGTRIGLSAMVDNEELLGWATSLASGEPLPDVELRLVPSGVRGTTGPEGLAVLPLSPGGDHLLVARRGEDSALLPENPYGGWWHEGSWRRQEVPGELHWLLFTDRGLYQPGEEVHLKGWIRRADTGEGGDLELPRGVERVALTVGGPRGEEILRAEARPGPLGGFSSSFELPEALNLGHASLQLEALGPAVPEAGRHAWHGVAVQEFRRPEYEVSLEADPGPHLVGGNVDASLRASYYSGGGLPEAAVEWRASSGPGRFSPPGWDEWHFGRAPWWGPWPGEEGEYRQESLSGTTGADGTHRVRVELLDVDPPFATSLHLAAQAQDVNRQVGSAMLDLLVHPAALYAGLRTDRRWVEAGDSVAVDLAAVDLAGTAVPGREIEVRAERMEWGSGPAGWTAVEEEVVCRVASAGAPVGCAWVPSRAGSFRLRAEVRDERGRASRTELPFWVAGGGPVAQPERPEGQAVEVVPDRPEYQPGDTAEVLVRAPFSPARGVLSLRRAGLLERRAFRMEGPSERLRVPITEAHLAGVQLRVDLVDEERGTELAAGETRLSVPPRRRELSVRVAPGDPVVFPGAQTTVEVEVSDAAGRPAAGAEVALWMVDEAVLSLGGYGLPDPMQLFYPDRSGGVRDHHLRPWVVLAPRSAGPGTVSGVLVGAETGEPLGGFRVVLEGTGLAATVGANGSFTIREVPPGTYSLAIPGFAEMRAREVTVPEEGVHLGTLVLSLRTMEFGGRGGGPEIDVQFTAGNPAPPPAPPVMAREVAQEAIAVTGKAAGAAQAVPLRTDFAPLAFFEPSLRTGPDGRVRVPVRVPESLTRYRIMAVAVEGARRFGRGEASLTARRDLTVRPSAPRFLNFGDRVELPVVVQNATDAPLEVEVAVRASGLTVEGPRGRRVTVPARDRVEVRFPAVADSAGVAHLQAVAASGARSDAAGVSFPVYTPATTEAFATYGELDTSTPLVLPVAVPEGVVEGFGGLEVTVSSTALQELTDAVLYLRRYPFEGAEQIASRLLGIAGLREVLAAFAPDSLPSPEEVEEALRSDVAALAALQSPDGGWGLWRADEPSHPFVSVHAAHALQRAREEGLEVPAETMRRALDFLRAIEGVTGEYPPRPRAAILAYALYVRERAGDPGAVEEARRMARPDPAAPSRGLPPEAAGWLLHALADEPAAAAERAELLRYLRNRATETASTATFASSYEEGEHLLLHSDRRSDAVVLEALIAADPRSDLVPKTARGLLAHRVRGRWRSTQENAWVLLALERYFRAYEGVVPDFRSRLWLGERFAGGHAFEGRTTERHRVEVPMAEVARADSAVDLTLVREGEGRLYYRAGLRYAPADLSLDPLERGFAVERAYEAVDDPADVRRDPDGAWRIRAGARVRVRLTLTAPSRRHHAALVDPLPAGLEPLNPELRGTGLAPEPPPPPPDARRPPIGWSPSWFVHQNLRDDRAEAFATLLPAGRYEYVYTARATTPGVFVVPPPRAEEMYAPETFGRGASARVVVEAGRGG